MGMPSIVPPSIVNASSGAEAVKLAFEGSWYSSFRGLNQRQIAIDLMVGHARNKYALRLDTLRNEFKEAEVAAALKLSSNVEAARAATWKETEKELIKKVNRLGREFVDTGYLLFRKRIQKLYPDLDISGVDDVEVEDSAPTSPEPASVQPAKDASVEDIAPAPEAAPVAID
ncbi:hypothetical protein F0562_018259 [Nyssa sinensis]|uniref:Uncharacterized protein n=1 Tax=Nyssa sinensis TaxID=561372 RepID=A0A5J4ZB65_9ASTE|nr:hypothetical protein F0562_018259 [Nyssa sinensis]